MLEDVIVPKSEHQPAERLEIAASAIILCGAVLAAVSFDDKLAFDARKIGDEWADRHLSPELEAVELTIAHMMPESALGIGRALPKLRRMWVGSADFRHARPLKKEHPHPLAYRRVDLSRKRAR